MCVSDKRRLAFIRFNFYVLTINGGEKNTNKNKFLHVFVTPFFFLSVFFSSFLRQNDRDKDTINDSRKSYHRFPYNNPLYILYHAYNNTYIHVCHYNNVFYRRVM